MRKFTTLGIVLITLLTSAFSCHKTGQNYMHATNAAGAPWTANQSMATSTTEGVTIQGTYYGNNATIAIYLPKNYTTGTYTIDTGANSAHASYQSNAFAFEMAAYGTVTLTSVSPNIIGTFDFACADSLKVQEGNFSVKAP